MQEKSIRLTLKNIYTQMNRHREAAFPSKIMTKSSYRKNKGVRKLSVGIKN